MKKYCKLISLLLAAVMLFTLLTACKSENPDPEESPEETVEPSSAPTAKPSPIIAAGGFEQDNQPDETPEPSQNPTGKTGRYGGIPIPNIMAFIATVNFYSDENRAMAFGIENMDKVMSDYSSEWNKYESKSEQECLDWLDSVFLDPDATDYDAATPDDIDEARNMIIVVRAAAAGYVPSDALTLNDFLTGPGLEIYRRWRAKIGTQEPGASDAPSQSADPAASNMPNSGGSQEGPSGGHTGTPNPKHTQTPVSSQSPNMAPSNAPEASRRPGTQTQTQTPAQPSSRPGHLVHTANLGTINVSASNQNTAQNGDVDLTITARYPDAGSSAPQIVFLFKDAYGETLDYKYNPVLRHDDATGVYTYAVLFNQRRYAEDGSNNYSIAPVQGHVYAFRIPEGFQIADWGDLTIDQCQLIY